MKDGVDGLPGKDGKDGVDGKDGKDGVNGKDGKDGKNGLNGKDGLDGKDGKQGPKGEKGEPGKDGKSISAEAIKKLEKRIKDSESNLLYVNNGGVKSVVAGTNISITGDPQNPIISSTASGGITSINGDTGPSVTLTIANTGSTLQWSGTQLQIPTATGSVTGLLLSTDFNTFNNKLSSLSSPLGTMDISGGAIDFNGKTSKRNSYQTAFTYAVNTDINDLNTEQASLIILTLESSGNVVSGIQNFGDGYYDVLDIIVKGYDISYYVTFAHASGDSSSQNQFYLPNNADLRVYVNGGIRFIYSKELQKYVYQGKIAELPTLSDTRVWIGNASNVATEQTIGGDVSLSNTGVATIANNAVNFAKMQAITDGNLLGASGGTAIEQITPDTNYFSMTSNTLGFKTNAGDKEILFQDGSVLNGALNTKIDSNGNLNIQEDGTVASPSNGVTLFTKSNTGRRMLGQQDVSGDSYRYQPSNVDKTIRYMQALGGNTSTTYALGITAGVTGSSGAVALGTGSYFAQINRLSINTAASSGASATLRNNGLIVYRGNASGRGGFFFTSRGGIGSASSNATLRWWTGLYGTNSAIGNVEPDTLLDMVGFGINAGETTIRFYTNDGAGTASRTDLGAKFPANALSTDMYTFEIWCAPNASEIFWRCTRENTGDVASGSVSSNLPTNTVFMHPQAWINTGTTATGCSWHFSKITLESNN